MSFPDQFLETPPDLDAGTHERATKAMRHARARLNASTDDLRTVLNALFAPVLSLTAPTSPSQVRDGTPLSPSDKTTIRMLIAAGRDDAVIAEQVGCSKQAVVGVRFGMRKSKQGRA